MWVPKVYSIIPVIMLFAAPTFALEAIEDASLSDVTGEGIAYLPENFKIVFDDTAYVTTLLPDNAPLKGNKAELAWYGLAFAGDDGNVTDRVGNAIASWGTANNPWILKAETLTKIKYDGSTAAFPVLSYYAPTYSLGDGELKYGFWGDIVVRNNTTNAVLSRMQSQSVWTGVTLNGSRFSVFQSTADYTSSAHTTVSGTTSGSLGMSWLNRINSNSTGKFRFSVAGSDPSNCISVPTGATCSSTIVAGRNPTFNVTEGMFVTDFDINMIVGNLHYQPVIMGATGGGSRNFQIELVRIPDVPAVYNEFYRNYSDTSQQYKMCTGTTVDCSRATHGELSAAKFEFKNTTGATVDLGSAKFEGLMVQHLKIKTLGL